ncbi:hypothetical protein A0J52_10010 [Clostridium sporogenes]|uniref:hypothetical protein n=1 Tax=Clostridium sporogenes TaxID=1509 RepID=UPI00077FEC91|nr:hypothetical protein [Clostridium sporogenes]KYN77186.1 hypothetical protein A0J52_10010 [Clostridium sporogenes]
MKYIFVNEDGFGFKDPEINEILEKDVQISDEIYNTFFKLQSDGKQFKIKEINGLTFWDIFDEVIPEPVEQGEVEPSPIEKLQQENKELKKQIEDTQKSMAEVMNLIAMQGITPKE